MANQLIGLFNPNATTFQKVRDSIILAYKLKRVTANREQIIKAAEQWGGTLTEEEIQQLLAMQEQFPEPTPLPEKPYSGN